MTRYRKSWTQVIQEVILNEALKPLDKSVIDAFYYRKEKEGKVLSTDGDTLTKMGIGGQQIAKWVGRKVKITAVSDVKSTESILKYMKKSIPSGLFEEEVEATRMPMEAPVVLNEAFWKVSIPDMPPIFVEAGSASEIKSDMRTKLKSDVFKELEIERVSKTEMIKKYREMAKGDSGEEESKEEAKLDEGPFNKLPVAAKNLAKYAAKDKGGIDYDVFMWAAGMMKTGKVKELAKYTMKQDTDPRDKIIDIVKDTLGKAATEKIFPVKIRGEKVELDEVVGTDESVERVAIAISFFEGRKRSPSVRAKRDAMRDIGRDKAKDDDDDDEVKSTKADRERADRNIINKLKKSADVKGNYEIKFDKGPAKKVPYKLVKFALDKNEKMKPADKLKFQKELERSYIDFLKALKGM